MPDAAIAYVRISDPKQSDYSLSTQLDAIRAYAEQHGYTLAGVFEDGWSGASYRERPGLSALRDRVRQGDVQVVIAYALDRLSRNSAHTYILDEEFREHGARLELVTERYEDTAVGRLIRSVMAFVAEIEREKIIERSTRGRHARARSGKLLPGARPLYGYGYRDDTHAALDPDPITAPVVQRIYREVREGMPLRRIAERLTQDGIATPNGGRRWGQTTVQWIVRHPNYGGANTAWSWRPSGTATYATYDADNAVALPAGTIPPLVPLDTWQAANATLTTNRARARLKQDHSDAALFRGGHARCLYCGYPLYVSQRRLRDETVLTYRCESRHRYGTDCGYHSVRVDELDALGWQALRATILDPDGLSGFAAPVTPDIDLSAHDARIAAYDRQIANLTRRVALIDDDAVAAALMQQLRDVAESRRVAVAERQDAERVVDIGRHHAASVADVRVFIESVTDVIDTFDWHGRRHVVEWLDYEVRVGMRGNEVQIVPRARALE